MLLGFDGVEWSQMASKMIALVHSDQIIQMLVMNYSDDFSDDCTNSYGFFYIAHDSDEDNCDDCQQFRL